MIVVAAVAAVRARRRLTAVMLVGVTGYGTALLFVLHGAPDLALTQFLVETLDASSMFVLVLRRLPAQFSARPMPRPAGCGRIAIGVAVGVVVAGHGRGRRRRPAGRPDLRPASRTPAVAYGGGRNIVNVILVDIRAWDTMGEISVLVVAATGVASLIFRRSRDRTAAAPAPAAAAGRTGRPAG